MSEGMITVLGATRPSADRRNELQEATPIKGVNVKNTLLAVAMAAAVGFTGLTPLVKAAAGDSTIFDMIVGEKRMRKFAQPPSRSLNN